MLLAIGLQESRFRYRIQRPAGPARGFWQFERGGGVAGVLTHSSSRAHLRDALVRLCYAPDMASAELHTVIAHNDIAAAVCARLLLWTDPRPLPRTHEGDIGWACYLRNWRPGTPHIETWPGFYAAAWHRVSPLSLA